MNIFSIHYFIRTLGCANKLLALWSNKNNSNIMIYLQSNNRSLGTTP